MSWTISKCGLGDRIWMCSRSVLSTFTPVIGAVHLWLDQSGQMFTPSLNSLSGSLGPPAKSSRTCIKYKGEVCSAYESSKYCYLCFNWHISWITELFDSQREIFYLMSFGTAIRFHKTFSCLGKAIDKSLQLITTSHKEIKCPWKEEKSQTPKTRKYLRRAMNINLKRDP